MNLCYKTLGNDLHLERYLNAERFIISDEEFLFSVVSEIIIYTIYIYTYMTRSSKHHIPAMDERYEICHFDRNIIETNFLLRDRALLFPFLLSSRDPITPRVKHTNLHNNISDV